MLSSVGRRRHAQLKQLFAPNVFAYSENSKEITKTLADVFDVRKENIQNLQINRVKNESLLEKSELNFDLKYFKQLLKHSFVEEKEVMEHLDEVKTMVLLYGLDELQLVKQLEKASTLQATGSTFLYSSGMSTKNLNQLLKSLLAMKKRSVQNPRKVQRGYHLKIVSLSKLAITMPRLNFWKR